MKALTTSIYGKMAGTTFETSIGGRLFKGLAPQGTPMPYVIFFVVSDVYDPTFTEDYENVLLQFSIFSEAVGSTEIEDIFTNLKAVYDNTAFTPTGNQVVVMTRQNAMLTTQDADVESGAGKYWQYDIEYDVIMQKT